MYIKNEEVVPSSMKEVSICFLYHMNLMTKRFQKKMGVEPPAFLDEIKCPYAIPMDDLGYCPRLNLTAEKLASLEEKLTPEQKAAGADMVFFLEMMMDSSKLAAALTGEGKFTFY